MELKWVRVHNQKHHRSPNNSSKGAKELLQAVVPSQLLDRDHHCSLRMQNKRLDLTLIFTSNIIHEEARRTSMIALSAM